MNDSDKIGMTINIGGEHIQLSVAFDRQGSVRDAEKAADSLYNDLRSRWPNRSDKEVLAMVAYQFAFLITRLHEVIDNASAIASDIDNKLSALIAGESDLAR